MSKRCPNCGINFPFGFSVCSGCGNAELEQLNYANADPDYEQKAQAVKAKPPLEVQKRVRNRRDRLRDAGYRGPIMEVLASAFDVDLHDCERLAEKGCPPDLAARILL